MAHSPIGLLHLISALLAVITGSMVLLNAKGGVFHKRAGYVYVASMVVLNGTALMIYRLFGTFGSFHILAVFSSVSILGGMVPAVFRHRVRDWLIWHYYFMNWSVVGLYAAFWAETFTRTLPMGQFWPIVVVATSITTAIGGYLIRKNAVRFEPLSKLK
ncbi:DUF2306 domain-containing protein [Spirosoma sp. KUDC1026]|uniref:DUF2306 domain-containing protein n=1 Tax=Spirosoma sp. KUDC1026 TaxID=2745947 RepID=UPI00159BCE44|nr:DUF2306 domain-containing protein [Spirosoma sp. KUDC1026]QKZ13702.1 DUF2306 domain-containing protein [Spirosoma sp. KUDC1026]